MINETDVEVLAVEPSEAALETLNVADDAALVAAMLSADGDVFGDTLDESLTPSAAKRRGNSDADEEPAEEDEEDDDEEDFDDEEEDDDFDDDEDEEDEDEDDEDEEDDLDEDDDDYDDDDDDDFGDDDD